MVKRLRHHPFTVVTRVRVPLGSPKQKTNAMFVFYFYKIKKSISYTNAFIFQFYFQFAVQFFACLFLTISSLSQQLPQQQNPQYFQL